MNPRRLLWAVFLPALLASCGIRADSQPREIAANDRPPLTDQAGVPRTTAAPGNPQVYLIASDGKHLVGSNRDVSGTPAILRALLDGPTSQDSDKSFTSAIPLNTKLVDAHTDATILTITLKLDPNGQGFAGPNGPKAFAQLVYTATSDPEKARGVKVFVDGQQIGIDGDGKRTVDRPLTRSDFGKQAPDISGDVKTPGGTLATTTTTEPPPATTTTVPVTTAPVLTTVAVVTTAKAP